MDQKQSKTKLKTGQLRRTFGTHSKVNAYDLYAPEEVKAIGATINLVNSRRLVVLRSELRDSAAACLMHRNRFARAEPPSDRAEWLKSRVVAPATALRASLLELEVPTNGYLQDLAHSSSSGDSMGSARLFLRDLEKRILKLERLAQTATEDLKATGQRLSNSQYYQFIVDRFSIVYLRYKSQDSVALNKRYPGNSAYMQFVRKSAKPLIGYEHGLVAQMEAFRDSLS